MPAPTKAAALDSAGEAALIALNEQLAADPLAWTLAMFDWSSMGNWPDGTPIDGPDAWQVGVLEEIRQGLMKPGEAIQIAVSSGHGVGKTCLIAIVILWFMATHAQPQCVVTSNTATQLTTKTWRELAKWWRRCRVGHWFQWTATRFYARSHPDTWFAAATPWTKERSEAFAGTHEQSGVLMVFDEASAIDDAIWEVVEGAMTTPGAIWICFGNPTRNSGRFRECFRKFRQRWVNLRVDSRTCKAAAQQKIKQWIEDYGVDSDFVRVRVRGVFPRSGTNQLIPSDLIFEAQQRVRFPDLDVPKVLGVDPARFGDDESVAYLRQGLCTLGIIKWRGLDGVQLANRVAHIARTHGVDCIFVDEVGLGASCCDQLRRLGAEFIPVNNSHAATQDTVYFNLRSEMWWRVREWLMHGGAIPADDPELIEDLETPEYGYDNKDRVQLERKDDIKDRMGRSPDTGDALALTFAFPVAPKRRPPRLHGDNSGGETSWMAA